jgi:ribonuclease Z
MAPPTYVVPKAIADNVENLLDAFRRLDGSDLAANIVGIGPGESLNLSQGMVVRPLRAYHRVPCQGYALMEVRRHLKPELVGQGREVIMAARERGDDINVVTEHPKVVFSGDTKIEFLDNNPLAQQADLLIMEVSFIDDRVSVKSSRENGHIHIDELAERAELFKNKAILFTHLSARYRQKEALDAIDKKLPPELRERVTLVPRPDWCP